MKFIIYKLSLSGIKRIFDCRTRDYLDKMTKTMSSVLVQDPDGNFIEAWRI